MKEVLATTTLEVGENIDIEGHRSKKLQRQSEAATALASQLEARNKALEAQLEAAAGQQAAAEAAAEALRADVAQLSAELETQRENSAAASQQHTQDQRAIAQLEAALAAKGTEVAAAATPRSASRPRRASSPDASTSQLNVQPKAEPDASAGLALGLAGRARQLSRRMHSVARRRDRPRRVAVRV